MDIKPLSSQIINLTKYNLWSNEKLVSFLQKLDPPLLDKEIISSFNSLRKTLYHIWDAELIWYKRMHGTSLSNWPSKDFKGSNAEAFSSFLEQSGKFVKLAENMNEEMLSEIFTYKSLDNIEYSNSRANAIIHVMNHSTFHRGQMVTMLRHAGFTSLSSTDYITFIRENN